MPRPKTKDLLLAVALIVLGLISLVALGTPEWWLSAWSLPLICAGLFAPFNRTWQGLEIGCLLIPVAVFLAFIALLIVCMIWGVPAV